MKRLLALAALQFLLMLPFWAQESPRPDAPPTTPAGAEATPDASGHASDAHGADGHDSHGSTLGGENATLWKTANFVILVGLLVYLLRGKVGPFFAEHNKSIARGMASAAAKAEEANARLTAIETRLANLDQEIAGLREHAAVEMERDRQRIQQEAATAIERLQERAESEIRSATSHAQAKLRHQTAELALELAERQVRTEIASADVRNNLLTKAIERLSHNSESSRN